ncbi:MAG: ABC transporter ATP-binding protein [Granulosicoccus sp.]
MADVSLRSLSKRFGKIPAVKGINIDISDGEFVVLLGPTGAGKTTTLRLLAGLENPDEGSVHIGGKDMTKAAPSQRDVSFVFQQYSLYPHLSVRENLAFPLKSPAHNLKADQIKARVEHVASLVQIAHKLDNRSTALSGGEMQRVAIGRALVRDPAIFLMDEPLSSLDAKLRGDLRIELKRIQKELGATLLYVTHDQIEAMTMADRIGILNDGELIQLGAPRDIYENPVNVHVAARLGQPAINLVPLSAMQVENAPSGAVTMGLRTEHIEVLDNTAPVDASAITAKATLDRVEHLGDQNRLHMRLGDHKLVTLGDGSIEYRTQAGESMTLQAHNALYFDSAGARVI